METPRAIPHDMWEQLPPETQAYIQALEARVEALEAMVPALQEHNRALQEQLNQLDIAGGIRPNTSELSILRRARFNWVMQRPAAAISTDSQEAHQ